MLRARLLGQFEILIDDQPVILPTRPCQSLLAYLLLHPNKSHRREKLAGQFWPETSESNARSNLRHALWRVRKALGPGATTRLESDDFGVAYHPGPGDQLDVDTFEACPEEVSCTDELLLALSAYGGELLPGFYEEWVVLERERLEAAFERLMGRLLERLLAERRWDEALEWGEHWVASGSIPEPAYRALMVAHAGLGNLAAAATQYQRCVETLARELGVEPSERTRKAFEQIIDGGLERIQPGPAITPQPVPIASLLLEGPDNPPPVFVGREAELLTLAGYLEKSLHGQVQVVFVSGEAGSGKSALFQAFLRRSMAAHPDLVAAWGDCNAFFGQGDPFLPFRDVLNMLAGDLDAMVAQGTISRNQANQFRTAVPLVIQALLEQGPDLVNTFLNASTVNRLTGSLPGKQSSRERFAEHIRREPALGREAENIQLFEQYTQVLRGIASQHPVLILLDDLHWMDPGSGRLLFHLVRRLQNARLMIAGAYRGEEVACGRHGERHPLEPLLNELRSCFGEISIDLDQARETSGMNFIHAFLDTEPNLLDQAFRQELYHKTQGNPLFTIQLLRDLQERGEILPDKQNRWVAAGDINWKSLPPQVEGIIGQRFGRLDRDLQDLLLAASVEGEQFTVQVLERLQGIAGRAILRQLSRELEKRHRLVQELGETCVGGQRIVRFRFVHGVIQQYLYHQLGAAERALLHQEVAETLELLYADDLSLIAVPLARHYREAGVKGKAVEYLLLAGDQARKLFAHPEAVDHYQQALTILKEFGPSEEMARTLMKLYLVYHNSFDFQHAGQTLEEANLLWQRLAEQNLDQALASAKEPYRLPTHKTPNLDPGQCETIFDLELVKELYCGLVEWSQDWIILPLAARQWEVLDGGRRYIFHLRHDLQWSDGEPLTAADFEFAWKRVLDPETHSLTANLLYDIRGAKDFHQGRIADPQTVGVSASDPYTLLVELEEPCGYFLYILGDPVAYPVPRHILLRQGQTWTEPGRVVTNGAFHLDSWDLQTTKEAHFTRNPYYFGRYKGNIERVTLAFYENELEIFHSFVAGELDTAVFVLPQFQQEEWKHYLAVGQVYVSTLPFVDAVYFVVDRPPFDNPDLRRAFALATDRERLAREMVNKLPAIGGYIPPSLPAHTPQVGLPYSPEAARRLLAEAGYSNGVNLPDLNLLIEIVGLEKGDNLVFALLQEMWQENLGVTIHKRRQDPAARQFDKPQDFHFFFTGWFADFPDPASFLQTNFLLDQCHWHNPVFEALVNQGRRIIDQDRRVDLYRQADRILIEEAVVLPLFYGHIYELRQPWVKKLSGSSIYCPQWKDISLMPH